MALAPLAALALITSGCRTSVEGWWSGTSDGEPMLLKLEQTGSSVEGEVCTDQACTPIEWGEIDERRLELSYGCSGCALPSTSLDLILEGGRLVGEADVTSCPCSDGADTCDCRAEATFFPCEGACAAGAEAR